MGTQFRMPKLIAFGLGIFGLTDYTYKIVMFRIACRTILKGVFYETLSSISIMSIELHT